WRYLHRLCHAELVRFTAQAWRMVWSPDGRLLAGTGYPDETFKVFDARSGQERFTCPGQVFSVVRLAFSPDGNQLISVGHLLGPHPGIPAGIEVKTWDTVSGKETGSLRIACTTTYSGKIVLSADGRRIAFPASGQNVSVLNATTGQELFPLHGPLGFAD